MTIGNAAFSPAAALTHNGSEDSLLLKGPDSTSFKQDEKLVAKVTLKDGRVLDLDATVQASRPSREADEQERPFGWPGFGRATGQPG